jgi:D-alanyl-D-alanine carboxypeptidase/D-alanyl-D-alanine-endopeptidase (penicillin-binding protein 4)
MAAWGLGPALGWFGASEAMASAHAARRAAAPPAADAALLPSPVRKGLAASGLPLASFGLYAAPVGGGPPLLSLHADAPYVLASTAKLVTAFAALDLLGPTYRWRTRAYLLGELQGGRLDGDLLIVGGGDVQLSADSLREWFAHMRAEGLREVRGNILLDRAAFHLEEQDYAGTPTPAPDRPHHLRPDALTLDGGVVRVAVQPSRSGLALVSVTPPLGDVRLVNSVSMAAASGCSASALFRPQRGRPELQVSGSWSKACGAREIEFAPLSADELMLRAVAELWRQTGGTLKGRVMDSLAPGADTLWPRSADGRLIQTWSSHASPPLAELVHTMNKSSDNVAARHLMLSLSPGFPRRPATMAGAQTRVRDWLRAQGLADGDIVLDNGSGLSRAERAKPAAMVQLLQRAWRHTSGPAFFDSLPIAGVDGTLAHRLSQPGVQGRAHLKTGTLLDTRALAGYVQGRDGGWVAVAALANHPDASQAVPALDAAIDWLARH